MVSSDGKYRYRLTRVWGDSRRFATFIMLNPSTADATEDDPTIRRCIGFTQSWSLGALVVVNLYAFRATNPADLRFADDPVGPGNGYALADAIAGSALCGGPLVAAWGAGATRGEPDRVRKVLRIPGTDRLSCLGVNKDGSPRHPLYVPAVTDLRLWSA
jgi:hypothetical protein